MPNVYYRDVDKIRTICGSVVTPMVTNGTRYIINIVNDSEVNAFTKAITAKYGDLVEYKYQSWRREDPTMPKSKLPCGKKRNLFRLGEIRIVDLHQDDLQVVNMIACHSSPISVDSNRRLDRPAFARCLFELRREILHFYDHHSPECLPSVHFPQLGGSVASAVWDEIKWFINLALCQSGIPTYVYVNPGVHSNTILG